ncbi:MAG: hypothetical protein H8E12_07715 [Rhodobacteraceae bacterium]|nr:hypothetical protein [Paracoccaceae bacterium]
MPVKEIGITDFVSARESLSTKFIEESNMVSEEVTTSSSAVDLAKKLKESRNK